MKSHPPARLLLPAALRQQMVSALQAVYPLEGCGLLAGRAARVTGVYPIANVAASRSRFRMAAQAQVTTMLALDEAGLSLLAIYHSHPHGPARPSATDIATAYYPDAAQVIVSLADRNRPVVRAFTIVTGTVREIPLAIV